MIGCWLSRERILTFVSLAESSNSIFRPSAFVPSDISCFQSVTVTQTISKHICSYLRNRDVLILYIYDTHRTTFEVLPRRYNFKTLLGKKESANVTELVFGHYVLYRHWAMGQLIYTFVLGEKTIRPTMPCVNVYAIVPFMLATGLTFGRSMQIIRFPIKFLSSR